MSDIRRILQSDWSKLYPESSGNNLAKRKTQYNAAFFELGTPPKFPEMAPMTQFP
jgi:hypothetical protein